VEPTNGAAPGGRLDIGTTAKQVAEHASAITRLEIELAKLELQRKAAAMGVGAGLVAGAALLLFFAVGFLFAAVAAGIATVTPWWAALLIVTGLLILVAVILGLIAKGRFKSVGPVVPEDAIREAKLTKEAIQG
jgi:hypothetical protein